MNEVMDGNVSLRKVEVAPVVPPPAPISPPVVNPAAPDGRQAVTRNADWTPVVQDFNGTRMVLVPVGSFDMGSENGGQMKSQYTAKS
ncbi:MAG: hypothetical protein R2880_17705 [Deinococcales bacterium]